MAPTWAGPDLLVKRKRVKIYTSSQNHFVQRQCLENT